MKLAIVGYGNLGKSLERAIEKDTKHSLVAVYSRRNLDNAKFRPLPKISEDGDFDAALIALGSYDDAKRYAPLYAKHDTVDSFDTHAEIPRYKDMLNGLNTERVAIVGAGWDPGTLSLARGIFSLSGEPVTVWGKGISQGHSNAIRSIAGVIDAVQFTLPAADCEQLIEGGERDVKKLHKRLCYVACVQSDCERVKKSIVSMLNYFDGYDVEVRFVTPAEVRRLKEDTSHCGQVYCAGNGVNAYAKVSLECNTALTAQIMLRYLEAIPQLKRDGYKGALDVFDVPLKYVADRTLV